MSKKYPNCEEMIKLRQALDERGVKWYDGTDYGTISICRTHTRVNGKMWSIVHGYGTYGGFNVHTLTDAGLLEAWDMETYSSPVGFLTAAEVIKLMFEGVNPYMDARAERVSE